VRSMYAALVRHSARVEASKAFERVSV